jgi:hypothetical protein
MYHAIEQAGLIAERFRRNDESVEQTETGGERILIRKQDEEKAWRDEWIEVEDFQHATQPVSINKLYVLSNCADLPIKNHNWLLDVFFFPQPWGGPGQRPYYPQMLIVVDADSGDIIGHDLFQPGELVNRLQIRLVDICRQRGHRPYKIIIPRYETYLLLEELAGLLNIMLDIEDGVEPINNIKSSLFGSLSI